MRVQRDTEDVNLSPNRWRVIGGIAAIVLIEAGDGTRDFNDGPCYGSLDLDVEYDRHNIGQCVDGIKKYVLTMLVLTPTLAANRLRGLITVGDAKKPKTLFKRVISVT